MMNCWAMRIYRDYGETSQFLLSELQGGRLRQGWGGDESQNLVQIYECWDTGRQLTPIQQGASRHWRMGNGPGDDHMQVDDLVAVMNTPADGLFTICRITGQYRFDIADGFGDFGHVRPVEVLTPQGVSYSHQLVHADLRRSFRCRLRLWSITPYCAVLNHILNSGIQPEELACGTTPEVRVDSAVSELVPEQLSAMADRLGMVLPAIVRVEEWEPVLTSALESLFPVSVSHVGGPHEYGADIEIVIPNPFSENRDWIVPVQVKDYEGEVGDEVAEQLRRAFTSRNQYGQVIAVVLLVSNAVASKALEEKMRYLADEYHVPFLFCGRDLFLRLLARGFLRQS